MKTTELEHTESGNSPPMRIADLEHFAVECAKSTCPDLDPSGWNPRSTLRALYETAVHECGHAVVSEALGSRCRAVWLAPKWYEHRVAGLTEHEVWSLSKEQNAMVMLAGPLAEELLDGDNSLAWEDFVFADDCPSGAGWRDDMKNVRELLHAALYSKRVHRLAAHTEAILRTHWLAILRLAKKLLHGRGNPLTSADIRAAMGLTPRERAA